MDKLYIGDIPDSFCYAVFGTNYIDLFKSPNLSGNMERYRIYMYDNYFNYSHGYTTYSTTNPQTAQYIDVSNEFVYRRDFPSIVSVSVVFVVVVCLLCNIVTSVFKRGGIFGGLF